MRSPSAILIVAVLSLLLAACGSAATDDTPVRPIDDIVAGDVRVEPDPSGTVATLRVAITIPVACAVVYGTDERFGSIATDDDMAGGPATTPASGPRLPRSRTSSPTSAG